jgi:ABC-type branched-subunit amino acid transport system substrate-binding protein
MTRMFSRSRNVFALVLAGIFVVSGTAFSANNPDAKKTSLHIGSGAIVFDVFAPFSGPDARYGAHSIPSAEAGAFGINRSGGVLGHKFTITQTDSRGDPADAVPVLNQVIATTTNLGAVLGPTSDEGVATIPILQRDGIPTFAQAPIVQLDHLQSKWIFQILAPDATAGIAMAYVAAKIHHWTKAALMFNSEAGAQSLTGPVTKAFKKMGGQIVTNVTLTPDQASYRTEILKLLSAHPQVIFTETDAQTAATLWSEMQQMHGLTIPVIGSGPTTGDDYYQAVTSALGSKTALGKFLISITFSTKYTKATPYFLADLNRWKAGSDPLLNHVNYWDSINVIALAMLHAHSVNPDKWVPAVRWVTNDLKGTPVYNFQDGRRLMAKGKHITYIGTKGSMHFNKYGTVTTNFESVHFDGSGGLKTLNQISAAALTKY